MVCFVIIVGRRQVGMKFFMEATMAESPLMIPCGNLLLEARLEPQVGAATAVICHPHPLFGGSMDNNVVIALQRSLRVAGLGTLRFNFRGVGRSTGQHRGAQGDVESLLAVVDHLQQQGATMPCFAGYSYGAWIGLRALQNGIDPPLAILVSPPLDFLDFKGLAPPPCPCLITVGDRDEFCSLASVRSWTGPFVGAEQGVRLEILPGCDHFYAGFEKQLGEIISAFPGSIPA